MANDKETSRDPKIEQHAFELFTARRAAFGMRGTPEAVAVECFRDAEAFLNASKRIASGELKTVPPVGPQLADCCAPNLKKTHPVNMVSQRFGNLNRVREINARLQANEALEEIEELEWKLPEVNSARNLFPSFAASTN